MSEMEDKINDLLNNPASMEKISQLAAKFMGGGDGPEEAPSAPLSGSGFDPEMLAKIGKLMSRAGDTGGDKAALLKAMSPYLDERRRDKLGKAVKFAQMAKIAGIAFGEYGGNKGV